MVKGWFAQLASFVVGVAGNYFPALAGMAATVVPAFAKEEAAAIHKVISAFHDKYTETNDIEQAATAGWNTFETAEIGVITDVGKDFIQLMFSKAKHEHNKAAAA